MKKLLLVIALITTSFSIAQIKQVKTEKSEEIGKVAIMGSKYITLEKSGELYTVMYRDMKFEQLVEFKSFSFKDEDNALDNLYNMILKGLKEQPKEDIMLELPDSYVWLHFGKQMGSPYVEFYHSVTKDANVMGKSTWMNERKLKKLFGK